MIRSPLSLAGVCALALMATQLGGCVAVALVPLAAGTTVTGTQLAGRKSASSVNKAVTPVVIVGQDGASRSQAAAVPQAAAVVAAPNDSAGAAVRAGEAAATEPSAPDKQVAADEPVAPVPDAAPASAEDDGGFAAMTRFVLAAAQPGQAGGKRISALLDQRSLATLPRTKPCGSERGALLIDLDPGTAPFDLDDPPLPAPGLAEYLRTIRGTGTAVVWMATLPEASAKRLGTVLKATGLDPLGIDPVLLLRRNETRKQQILARADEDWCVLAIAGDRKADFDEVFDYLRNPDGPVAVALEQTIGAGWFLVPPPIK